MGSRVKEGVLNDNDDADMTQGRPDFFARGLMKRRNVFFDIYITRKAPDTPEASREIFRIQNCLTLDKTADKLGRAFDCVISWNSIVMEHQSEHF